MAYYITCETCGKQYDSSWVAEFNGSPEEVTTCSPTCSLRQYEQHSANGFKVGDRVNKDGYDGTITRVCEWNNRLVEVRLSSGTTCVGDTEITRA